MASYTVSEKESRQKLTFPALVTTFYVLLGSFAAGYNMTSINSPGKLIMDFMNETSISRGDGPISESVLTSLYALMSSIFAVGAGIGALSTQKVADLTGRKRLLWLDACVGLGAAVMMAMCKVVGSYELLFVGRFIVGLVAGFALGVAPFYLSEVLPQRYVGAAMVANSLAIQGSAAVSAVLGFEDIFATPSLWVFIVGFSAVLYVLQLLLAILAAHSPTFLLRKSREEEATKVLQLLRGTPNVQEELARQQEHIRASREQKELTVVQLLRTSALRKKVLLLLVSFVSMLFTGIVIVIFYSVTVLEAAGLSRRNARYWASAVSVSGVTVSATLIFFVHRLRRRVMNLVGLTGLVINGAVLTLALVYKDEASWLGVVAVIAVVGIAMTHSFGPAQVPFLMMTELFDESTRGAASSLANMNFWLCTFVNGYVFPIMQESLGDYAILPFVGLAAFFFVFYFIEQPESLPRFQQDTTVDMDTPKMEKSDHRDMVLSRV